jgi:hypothetical protein
VTPHLDLENTEAGIRAMEGHPFDEPRKRFSVLISVGGVFLEAHGVNMLESVRES